VKKSNGAKGSWRLSILLVAAWLIFLPSLSEAGEPFRLGVALGFTGTGSAYSKEGLEGIKLAVEEINAGGGMLGKHPIELFVKDTFTNPEVAIIETRRLISEDGVHAIIGTYSSAAALAIKPLCHENQVLHIATISNSEDITRVNFSPNTFSVVPNTYMQAKAVALSVSKMVQERNWVSYCTIASDYAWGRSTQELTVKFLKELVPYFRLVRAFWPPLGEKNFTAYRMAITAYRPDCLIGSLAGEDNAEWIKQNVGPEGFLRRMPYPGSLISVTELMDQADLLERGMIGLARAPFFAHLDVPIMEAFVGNYLERYKRHPSDWAVLSYDGVHILRQGIEKQGSIEKTATPALRGMTVDTSRGKLFFREIDNQLSCSSYTGVVTNDPKYPFPIYGDLMEIKGPDSWRPEGEILNARTGLVH
jgi:branched-chain amino acid transport system substrate-binding protein